MSSHLKVHQVANPTHHTQLLISLIALHSPISMDKQGLPINEETFQFVQYQLTAKEYQ